MKKSQFLFALFTAFILRVELTIKGLEQKKGMKTIIKNTHVGYKQTFINYFFNYTKKNTKH